MKVGINATCLNDRPSGARQRFIGIYGALFRQMSNAEFVIYEPADCRIGTWFPMHDNVSAISTPIPSTGKLNKVVASIRYWGKEFASSQYDIFEGMHLPLFRPRNAKTILTIHDIRDLYSVHATMNQTIYRTVLRRGLKSADHVVTVSYAMRSEILNFYSGTPISVVYNGIDPRAMQDSVTSESQLTLEKLGVPDYFILSVGHLEKRKNYNQLLDALALLKQSGYAFPLVIVGNDSGEKALLKARINDLELTGFVSLLSGLSDDEVRCLYQRCSLFVFPSIYEGFGIPILEAMAAQKPMVLSDLQVFKEITENQVFYFEPGNVSSLSDAIRHAMSSVQERKRMTEYGISRISDFGFEKLALKMTDVYKEVLCGHTG